MSVDWDRVHRERRAREQRAQARARAEEQTSKKLVLGLGCLLLALLAGLATVVLDHPFWLRAALQLAGLGLAVLLVSGVEKTTGAPIDELPALARLAVRGLALALMLAPALAFLGWALATI